MIVLGSGPPLVLIPGIQGRWEWMRPAVEALAPSFTVATYSLVGEPGTGERLHAGVPFDRHLQQVDEVLGRNGWGDAVVCGVSYGGLVAVRYAAVRPEHVRALVLVSAPGPRWRPAPRVRRYLASPWASVPAFLAGAPLRLWPEIRAAAPTATGALVSAARHLVNVALAPAWPSRMAGRIRCLDGHDFARDAASVRAPTLVITGEPQLDQVVPVDGTLEYAAAIPGASTRMLARTGHLGLVTRSGEFAGLISDFVNAIRR
jgi:pimeloyl-ACP methyl ester carboxylesterase